MQHGDPFHQQPRQLTHSSHFPHHRFNDVWSVVWNVDECNLLSEGTSVFQWCVIQSCPSSQMRKNVRARQVDYRQFSSC